MSMKVCSVADCPMRASYSILCQKHYVRKKKYGTVAGSVHSQKIDQVANLLEKFYADYSNGMTTKTIAKKYGISSGTVWTALSRKGIIKSISEQKRGNKNPMWVGSNVQNNALHAWVRRNKRKPSICEICNIKPPFDLANISNSYNPKTYTRNLSFWQYICRSCHMKQDGRMDKLRENAKGV